MLHVVNMFKQMPRAWVPVLLLGCVMWSACSASEFGADALSGSPEGAASGGEGMGLQPGQLSAGEWRDLDNWPFWRGLFDRGDFSHLEQHWGFNTGDRLAVVVLDEGGEPASDLRVALLDKSAAVIWEARTDRAGEAELFVGLFKAGQEAALLMVEAGGERVFIEPKDFEPEGPTVIRLETPAPPKDVVDVMFMIDTTGSMGDELSYLQVELRDVIERVRHEHDLLIRTSVNVYRDAGDPYLVRSNPFSTNLDEVVAQLQQETAAGGGDFEEAVDVALEEAIVGHEWSPSARSRLLFLLLDAPPHHNPEALQRLHRVTREAARLGIRIIPIGASGIDKQTEFLMRFLDVSTGGTYVFLTDDSGIGQPHLVPSVGAYEVEPLNELLVRLISGSLR